jgi:hypothetical protein
MEFPVVRIIDIKRRKKFTKILKEKNNNLLYLFLEKLNRQDKNSLCWYICSEKLKYVTPLSLKLMLSLCENLKYSLSLEYLLLSERFDLVDMYLEYGNVPDKKLIKLIGRYEKKYKGTFIPKKPENPYKYDAVLNLSTIDNIEKERRKYKVILEWLKPTIKL